MGRSVEPDSLAPQLSRIRCPVLLLLGAAPHTASPPPDEMELLADSIPLFRTEAIPGAGHFLQEEAPELVAAAVDRARITWLARGALLYPEP